MRRHHFSDNPRVTSQRVLSACVPTPNPHTFAGITATTYLHWPRTSDQAPEFRMHRAPCRAPESPFRATTYRHWIVAAISLSTVATPPRVRSRRQWISRDDIKHVSSPVRAELRNRSRSRLQIPGSLVATESPCRDRRCSRSEGFLSPGRARLAEIFTGRSINADAGGRNEDLVALAAIDNLGITRHQLHAGFVGRFAHRIAQCGADRRWRDLLPG